MDPNRTSLGNTLSVLLPRLLADQRQRCQRGEALRVEEYLRQEPSLENYPDAQLDLIYQEIMLREQQGEDPTLAEYLGRFPQLAEALKIQFEIEQAIQPSSLEMLDSLAEDKSFEGDAEKTEAEPRSVARSVWSTLAPTTPEAPDAPEPSAGYPDIIAGHEILGILGRGGMGVVYKARQPRLNRIVALKMILSGPHAGSEEHARFRIEAEAIARMQHPNIVQIFEVGEDAGRPFLSLEYVSGGSLAHFLKGKPQPETEAAQRVETLARAMHHAHELGIVHRDLKPGNILVMADGSPKVTDFGLAKQLDEDSGRTHSGTILGTPSYMAPEQATGRISDIGPGTDLYSLGAILYEMLTGRPPFQGASVLETLQQVRTEEPVPPSRLRGKLSRDLEIICLKCLRKEPRQRYASAQELAEDLQRFLTHQPIRARPVGTVERTVKWARRRPALAALVVVVTAALLALMVGGWWSSALISAAKDEETLAKNNAIEAKNREMQQREQAEASFSQAFDAVERMLDEVGAIDLKFEPQTAEVRKKLIQRAEDFYRDFLGKRGTDPKVRLFAVRAQGRQGDIQEILGEHATARAAYERVLDALAAPEADARLELFRRRELARCRHQLGVLRYKLSHHAAAEALLRQALAERRLLAAETGKAEDRQELAASHYWLGVTLAKMNQPGPAEQEYLAAARVQEALGREHPQQPAYHYDRARTLNNLGILYYLSGRRDKARQQYEQAVLVQEALCSQNKDKPLYQRDLARYLNNLAGIFLEDQNRLEAADKYRRALKLLENLVLPTGPAYRQELAALGDNLGGLLYKDDQLDAAEPYFRLALEQRQLLVNEAGDVPDYHFKLARQHLSLGELLMKKGQTDAAEKQLHLARATLETLLTKQAKRAEYLNDLDIVQDRLANLLYRRGRTARLCGYAQLVGNAAPPQVLAGPAALGQGRADLLAAKAVQQQRTLVRDWHYYVNLAEIDLQLGDYAAVAKGAEELARRSKTYGDYRTVAQLLVSCVRLAHAEGRRYLEEIYAERCIAVLRAAFDRNFYRGVEELESDPSFAPLWGRNDFRHLLETVRKNMIGDG